MNNRPIKRITGHFRQSMLPGMAVVVMVMFSGSTIPARAAEAFKPALTKDYIDTTIMQAIFLLSEGASVEGVGGAREKAIAEAKMVAVRMRAEARGDRNESYVIWKVEELEGQITLEEEDLVMRKVRQGQATIGQIVDNFNHEVGNDHPDFAALQEFQSRMKALDPDRAAKMDQSIRSRGKSIARSVTASLEEALIYGNARKADDEFRYCLRNRQFFNIPPATFRNLEERVAVCDQSVEELKAINAEADSARALIAGAGIGKARPLIADAENRLSAIKGQILLAEDSTCAWRLIQLTSALKHCEDSLVQINLDILNAKGVDAASDYLNRVVHTAGVSREKSARIDQAILATGSPAAAGEGSAIGREVDAVAAASEADGSNDVFAEMRQKAVKKAHEHEDSLRAIDEERERVELARLDSMEAEAKKKAELEFQENRTHAMQISSGIYDMIKTGKPRVACDMFDNKKPLLRQYLIPEAFALLESTVGQLLDPKWETASNDIQLVANGAPAGSGGPVSPASGGKTHDKSKALIEEIYDLIGRNEGGGAVHLFDEQKNFLQTDLPADAFEMLATMIAKVKAAAH